MGFGFSRSDLKGVCFECKEREVWVKTWEKQSIWCEDELGKTGESQ